MAIFFSITVDKSHSVFTKGHTFKSFDLKWIDFNTISWKACEDENLNQQLQEDSKKVFLAMDGVGYGRTDMRVTPDGRIYFLEINPNCGLFYPPSSSAIIPNTNANNNNNNSSNINAPNAESALATTEEHQQQ